jgi:N utilization substance protein B
MCPAITGMAESRGFERRRRSRRRALQAIYQWQITGQSAGEILQQFRDVQDLSQVDEEHFEALLEGVIRQTEQLDLQLAPFLDRPVSQVDLMERVVIRIGAWELLNSRDIPYRVILDESIDLARRFGSEQGHAFVNAVLDKAAKAWRPGETGPGAA